MVDRNGRYVYFKDDFKLYRGDYPRWCEDEIIYCGSRFTGYGKTVVVLHGVEIHPEKSHGKVGGENIHDVIDQDIDKKYIRLEPGYFTMNCSASMSNYSRHTTFEMFDLLNALVFEPDSHPGSQASKDVDMVTIVTTRNEYANFYHMMMAWYDIFLLMIVLHIDPDTMSVIWLDAHPKSNLDNTWFTLYNTVARAGDITEPVYVDKMVWNVIGADSPINIQKSHTLPYHEEFRHYFLSRHDVTDDHIRNCYQLNIVIIWRRDHHTSHPRNPSGLTARKISNENEVIRAANYSIPGANVIGVQMDKLSMTSQLDVIAKADILIGTHGAGLSHILFLPESAGVIEIVPSFVSAANIHFRLMARFRHVPYIQWRNANTTLEDGTKSISIPGDIIQQLMLTMYSALCHE